jgi:hypothetical protein
MITQILQGYADARRLKPPIINKAPPMVFHGLGAIRLFLAPSKRQSYAALVTRIPKGLHQQSRKVGVILRLKANHISLSNLSFLPCNGNDRQQVEELHSTLRVIH